MRMLVWKLMFLLPKRQAEVSEQLVPFRESTAGHNKLNTSVEKLDTKIWGGGESLRAPNSGEYSKQAY